MDELLNLKGKTAIVLGAVGNLGTYIAKKLFLHGANIIFNYYKNEETKAAELAAAIDSTGSRVLGQFCDINDEGSVKEFVDKALEKFGSVDIMVNLVHNPDFTPTNVAEMEWKDWNNHLVAQKGHFLICKYVVPIMREQKFGRIIYISGGLAVRHMGGSAAFAAVKSGLTAFSKTLAIEEGPNNITVNVVAPGKVTSLHSDGAFSWSDMEADLLEKTPLRRFATQDDVANTVLYFASPIASSMTGQTLYVTCGEIML